MADAIMLPYVMEFNSDAEYAKEIYANMAKEIGEEDLVAVVKNLNKELNIASCLKEVIEDEEKFMSMLDVMAECAKADGCTKTNPIIPTIEQFKALFVKAYNG